MTALAIILTLSLLAALWGLYTERHDHSRTLQALRHAEGALYVAEVGLEVRGRV